jgi:hypothetical protein
LYKGHASLFAEKGRAKGVVTGRKLIVRMVSIPTAIENRLVITICLRNTADGSNS